MCFLWLLCIFYYRYFMSFGIKLEIILKMDSDVHNGFINPN